MVIVNLKIVVSRNFLEIIKLLQKSDKFMDHQLNGHSLNASYLATGNEVLRTILCEAIKTSYFAVIMNETTDLSHLVQFAIVVPYYNKNFVPVKIFISLTDSSKTTGEALTNIFLRQLHNYEFALNKLCAQTYNGVATMSGVLSGVQAIIRSMHPTNIIIIAALTTAIW